MTFSNAVAEWIVRTRWIMLLIAAIAAAAAWESSRRVEFDRSIENMFAADDPLLAPYRKLKEQFGGNEIVMGVYVDPNLLAKDWAGIKRLDQVGKQLEKIDGIQEVLSLARVNEALEEVESIGRLFGGRSGPPGIVDRRSRLARAFLMTFVGYTHDTKGRIAVLVCMLKPESDTPTDRRRTIDRIRAVIQQQPDGMIAGEPVMVADGFQYVQQDGERLGWYTTMLLALTIVLCFRSIRWVIIPILVVQFALVMTRATLVWADMRLSMVSSMLTAIVTVVGVATVVHVIVRFRQARAEQLDARAAMVQAAAILAVPIFWACTTDAVGFLSLTVAHVGPVRDFGIMTAIGSLWVLGAVILLVPGLALLGHFDTDPHQAWGEATLGSGLDRLVHSVQKHPRWLALLVIALAGGAIAGLMRLEVETDFTKNFRQDSPIVRSYAFIEQNLGGAGVWDVLVPAPETLSRDYLGKVRKLEHDLRAITINDNQGNPVRALTKVISLVDGIDAAAARRLVSRMPPELQAGGMERAMPHFTAALRTHHPKGQPNYLRIMLRAREQESAVNKSRLIDEVTKLARKAFPPSGDTDGAEVTGFYVLLTNLIKSMLSDQWVCFAVATVGIGLMMVIAFFSVRLAVVALVPNILPILLVLGSMGWLDIKINMGAAMIAAVSMGLSVDSSIHYIIGFRRALGSGKTVAKALAEVQQTVGRPIVFSTLALVIGFIGLCSSQFVPTIYFGSLVGLAMLGGLFGNLLVLPLLLSLVIRERKDAPIPEKLDEGVGAPS